MSASVEAQFETAYQQHLQHLQLKGLRPETIEAYSRAVRRIGAHFAYRIDDLFEQQLLNYFTGLMGTHSWSSVKLDLYGLEFFTIHVLKKRRVFPGLIKLSKAQRPPDIATVAEARSLFAATQVLNYAHRGKATAQHYATSHATARHGTGEPMTCEYSDQRIDNTGTSEFLNGGLRTRIRALFWTLFPCLRELTRTFPPT